MDKKKLSLNLSERRYAIILLDPFKGGTVGMAAVVEDVKVLEITKEEWEKGELKSVPAGKDANGQDQAIVSWNNEKGGDKECAINQFTFDYLIDSIKKKDEASEFTLRDKDVLDLKNKLYQAMIKE